MVRHGLLLLSLLASPGCASLSDGKHSVCELYVIPTQAKLWGKSRLAVPVAPGH